MSLFWRRRPRIQVDDGADRVLAHGAERAAAVEHNALHLRPVIAGRLVVGTLESADHVALRIGREQLLGVGQVGAEQRVHLGLGTILFAQFGALLLILVRVRVVGRLRPRRRQRRAVLDEFLPLDVVPVAQRRGIRLPRFNARTVRLIRHWRSVILVGQAGEVVAEFVHEQIVGPVVVGGRRAELAEDAAAAVGVVVDQDFDELIRRVLRQLAQGAIVGGQHITLAAEDVVAGAERRGVIDAGGRPRNARLRGRRRDGPDVEILGPLAERRHLEQVVDHGARGRFELAHLRLRVAVADDQQVDFFGRRTVDADGNRLVTRRLLLAHHVHRVGNTDAMDVVRKQEPARYKPIAIRVNGPSSEKVDLLIIGDGYTQAEMGKFEATARTMIDHLFQVSPFRERAKDFNVWAIAAPTPESGISRPSTGVYHASPLGTRYDIFGSERYVLATDNRALRELAQYAPYEFIEILVNNDTYGGGGIFGQFSTAAANNDWANYLFVHEFGHHFAGLPDEYYTSPVAYQSDGTRVEPWEPNATALRDPDHIKWKKFVKDGTPLPTPWPKAAYDAHAREYQQQRAALRKENRPESEMNALFRADLAYTEQLFSPDPNRHVVGAFEGANYESTGYYRPEMQCIMFDRSGAFCSVCQDAISTIIDLYARPAAKK